MKKVRGIKDPVLIVEDSKTVQAFFRLTCDQMGVPCAIAGNGEEALSLIERESFSLYIVDLMMPVMDGKTFIKNLKKRKPDAIILVQTTLDSSDTIIDIMKMGVFDYIIKPVDPELFRSVLMKVIEFKRLQNLEKEQLLKFRNDIAVVRGIQVSMLPRFDHLNGFDAASAFLSADDLSGDFLDGFFIDDDIYQIVLCDVAGHGMASSYIGTQIRSMFRTISSKVLAPSQVIGRVNNKLEDDMTEASYFATVAVCHINIITGRLLYSSGGHPPSLLYSAEKGECSTLGGTGPLIGVFKDAKYKDISFSMEKEDCLLFYTDGVTEAFAEDGRTMYEIERLKKAYASNISTPSIDIVHSILGSVYEFTNYSGQDDDITIICIKKL